MVPRKLRRVTIEPIFHRSFRQWQIIFLAPFSVGLSTTRPSPGVRLGECSAAVREGEAVDGQRRRILDGVDDGRFRVVQILGGTDEANLVELSMRAARPEWRQSTGDSGHPARLL